MLVKKDLTWVSIEGHPALNKALPNEPHQEHNLRICPYCKHTWNFSYTCTVCGFERNKFDRKLCENIINYHVIHNKKIVNLINEKSQQYKEDDTKLFYVLIFFSLLSFLIFDGWWLLFGGLPLTLFGSLFIYFTMIRE